MLLDAGAAAAAVVVVAGVVVVGVVVEADLAWFLLSFRALELDDPISVKRLVE